MGSSNDLYEDWPIEVKVFDKSDETEIIEAGVPDIAVAPKPKQKPATWNIRPFIKPVTAAAAVLLIAIFLLKGTVAKAVDFSDVYNALARIKNVCFTILDVEKAKPAQKIWVSRPLNLKMVKTEAECVLWELKGKSRKSKDLSTGSITTAKLGNDAIMRVEETMEGALGLLPFDDVSKVPPDAKWQKVAGEDLETTVPDTEVYDLMWTEKQPDGFIVYRKWRGYIDIETKLPKRMEWWWKQTKQAEYELLGVTQVAYPTNVDVRAAVEGAGF